MAQCPACTRAQAAPTSNDFEHAAMGCLSCVARCLAAMGVHVESEQRKTMTPAYRETLERAFGEQWKRGHEMVRDWGQKINAHRRRQAQA